MFEDILNNCKRSATAGCSFSSVAVAPWTLPFHLLLTAFPGVQGGSACNLSICTAVQSSFLYSLVGEDGEKMGDTLQIMTLELVGGLGVGSTS